MEYGTVGFTKGQVLGGRWKPLQYFYKSYLYTDLFIVCGADARCLVKNDNPFTAFRNATLVLSALYVTNSTTVELGRAPVSLDAGAGSAEWLCAPVAGGTGGGSPFSGCKPWSERVGVVEEVVLFTKLLDAAGVEAYSSFELLATPGAMLPHLHNATVTATVRKPSSRSATTVPVVVTADAAALFVGLTTAAHGRFSENFFVMAAGSVTVEFISFGPLDVEVLTTTLRVEHVKHYV